MTAATHTISGSPSAISCPSRPWAMGSPHSHTRGHQQEDGRRQATDWPGTA
ncbi:hypothetical protein [Streptomyces lydicus]|uniref:hypothetical protein n=1 Tax=Streptomyces lydicus TaxID=47763 RepID=UPI00343C1161